MAQWAIERYPNQRVAEKAAKRKLHQAYGAYITPRLISQVERIVDSMPQDATLDELKAPCKQVLKCHTSTRERLDFIEDLYKDIEQAIGRPNSVLDLASGLNPFALPWMALAPGASYRCVDIDYRLSDLVNQTLRRLPGDNSAICGDILISIPSGKVELVLLLKVLTCLEHQKPGVSTGFLRGLKANHVAVSYPTRSLGRRRLSMEANYDAIMKAIVGRLGWECTTLHYPLETVYLLATGSQ